MSEPRGDHVVVKTWPLLHRTTILPPSPGRPLALETTTFKMTTAAMIGSAITTGAWTPLAAINTGAWNWFTGSLTRLRLGLDRRGAGGVLAAGSSSDSGSP